MSERCIGRESQRVKGGQVGSHASVDSSTPTSNQPNLCMNTLGTNGLYQTGLSYGNWAGLSWSHGGSGRTQVNTILPPNGPSCSQTTNDASRALVPPTSYHPGGVMAMMCDGSVRFVSETINTGVLSNPSVSAGPSPYGVWGAMGSKDGGEAVVLP
jgi:prepilin-type processing-associated H-X9-DG protein